MKSKNEPSGLRAPAGRVGTRWSPSKDLRHSATPAVDDATKRKNLRLELSLLKFDTLPAAAHVKAPVVAALYGIGLASVWRWAGSGHLPAPVKLGPQATGWNVGQLREHLAARRAGE
jgi:predicted DNA-binding transcriptional regulator AlpA